MLLPSLYTHFSQDEINYMYNWHVSKFILDDFFFFFVELIAVNSGSGFTLKDALNSA